MWTSTPGNRTCRKCGCSMEANTVIMPGGVQGLKYVYRDASGKQLVSMVPLPCPAFVGNEPGAIAENRARIRGVNGRVDDVEDQVDSIETRLARLEDENEELRERLEIRASLDMEMLAQLVERQVALRLQDLSSRNIVLEMPLEEGEVIDAEIVEDGTVEARSETEEFSDDR